MRVRDYIGVVAFVTVAAVATLGGAAAIEAAQSAEVIDPAGDVLKNTAEPWQDIVRGRVVREGNTFTFSMEMAVTLPEEPPRAPGELGWYFWEWGLDTDPELAPEGWPFPKTHGATHDFMIAFISDGEDYFAFVADRRPLVLGLDPILTLVPCKVDGALIEVYVDADLLDDPAEFKWRCGTLTVHALPTQGFQLIDRFEAGYALWPQN
jgi:hypothetical protein